MRLLALAVKNLSVLVPLVVKTLRLRGKKPQCPRALSGKKTLRLRALAVKNLSVLSGKNLIQKRPVHPKLKRPSVQRIMCSPVIRVAQ